MKIPNPIHFPKEHLAECLKQIQQILYPNDKYEKEIKWDEDTVQLINVCLSDHDLSPGSAPRFPLTHVAIRFQGKVYSLPKPNRHHHVLKMIIKETGVPSVDVDYDDEGFLDEAGTYLNRKQAMVNAQLHNQILPGRPVVHGVLTSKNLWTNEE